MKTAFTQSLLGLAVLLGVAVIFQSQIITTIFWYKVVHAVQENSAVAIIPSTEPLTLPSTNNNTFPYSTFYALQVPLIFSNGTIKEDSSTVLAIVDSENNKTYSIWRGTKLAHQFIIDPRRTPTEIKAVCDQPSTASSPCDDNYQFLQNTLTATINDAHFFSTRDMKNRAAMYLLMKQQYLDGDTTQIIPLALNDIFSGYLFYAGKSATALVFENTDHDQPYQFVFSNMTPDEIELVLSKTTLK